MILADTSVWIDHLCNRSPDFSEQLDRDAVVVHPFVIGELALGHLNPRALVLELLHGLRSVDVATDDEVQMMIESHHLHSQGIGYVDAHLLASVMLNPEVAFWTNDKRLLQVASLIGLTTQSSRLL